MTRDDKSATLDASDGDAARGTVLAALVQGNLHAARSFGLDGDALERAAGLTLEAIPIRTGACRSNATWRCGRRSTQIRGRWRSASGWPKA